MRDFIDLRLVLKFPILVFIFLTLVSCKVATRIDGAIDEAIEEVTHSNTNNRSVSNNLNFDGRVIAIHPSNGIQIQKAIKAYFSDSGIETVALRDTFRPGYSGFLVISCQQTNKNYNSNLGMIVNSVKCVLKDGHSETIVFSGKGSHESYLRNVKNSYKAVMVALDNVTRTGSSLSRANSYVEPIANQPRKQPVIPQQVIKADFTAQKPAKIINIEKTSFQNDNPFQASHSEQRTALVIGIAKYQHISPLTNSENDAKDMANLLKSLGFSVTLLLNASQEGIEDKIHTFGRDLIKKGGVGLFYFAGHGVQHANTNFLIPVDANLKVQRDLKYKAVSLDMLMDQMDLARNGLNIIILDACRNNPLPVASRSLSRGLAQVPAPKGSFVAFATSPNDVASDGSGRNGVFTKYLLKHLGKKGEPLESVFKTIRKSVYTETSGEQTPWVNSSFMGDFSFAP